LKNEKNNLLTMVESANVV